MTWSHLKPSIAILLLSGTLGVPSVSANVPENDSRGRATAVALNYCRAAFHRIRRYESKRVLIEEQEKILNNLDLNGIDDEEVIRLYSSVLDEVAQIQIADGERELLKDKFRRTIQRQVGVNAFVLAAQVASGQFANAVRTGVNSWWDYRDQGYRRDLDVWKVDQDRIKQVNTKSTQFLDVFWKLTQKRNIPDRWLVRGDDLDKLEQCLQEQDLEVRLRVLNRMERFLECYPPYWYHVARAQQGLGQLFAAAGTYDKLADLAAGHFRKDDMLAAGLANLAMIQEYLQQPDAERTAQEALRHSTDVWEANLMCAYVLQRHSRIAEAEDAVLRNLDVGLEEDQSLLALVTIYQRHGESDKLIAKLQDRDVVQRLPVVVLLQCATSLGTEKVPQTVWQQLGESLYAYPELHFGPDDLVIVAGPGWQLHHARVALELNGHRYENMRGTWSPEASYLRFRGILDLGSDLKPESYSLQSATLILEFPDMPATRVSLQHIAPSMAAGTRGPGSMGNSPVHRVARSRNTHLLRVADISMGTTAISLRTNGQVAPQTTTNELTTPEVELFPNGMRPTANPAQATPQVPAPANGSASLGSQPESDLDAPPPPPLEDDVSLREQPAALH